VLAFRLLILHDILLGGFYLLGLTAVVVMFAALRSQDLSPESRPRIARIFSRFAAGHDSVRSLDPSARHVVGVPSASTDCTPSAARFAPVVGLACGMETKECLGWVSVLAAASATVAFARRGSQDGWEEVRKTVISF
jgi:hypothetical protein